MAVCSVGNSPFNMDLCTCSGPGPWTDIVIKHALLHQPSTVTLLVSRVMTGVVHTPNYARKADTGLRGSLTHRKSTPETPCHSCIPDWTCPKSTLDRGDNVWLRFAKSAVACRDGTPGRCECSP